MWLTCGLHIGPMDTMFGLDVVSMGLTCGLHVGPMDATSRPDVVSLGLTCRPHVRPMKFVKKSLARQNLVLVGVDRRW